jgi:hypothetical protein
LFLLDVLVVFFTNVLGLINTVPKHASYSTCVFSTMCQAR